MGIISREKAILEYEMAGYQSNLETWSLPIKRYVVPAFTVGGALFLLYIAGRKIFIKKKPKSIFQKLVIQSPVTVRRKRKVRIAKRIIGISTPIIIALIKAGLVTYLKKLIKGNGTTQRYPG